MNNYLGIGVDATITMAFHKIRLANPMLFSYHRMLNKLVYGLLGAQYTLRIGVRDLNLARRLKLTVHCLSDDDDSDDYKPCDIARDTYHGCFTLCALVHLQNNFLSQVDGEELSLPANLVGLVVLNLPSFAGGTSMWPHKEGSGNALSTLRHKSFASLSAALQPQPLPQGGSGASRDDGSGGVFGRKSWAGSASGGLNGGHHHNHGHYGGKHRGQSEREFGPQSMNDGKLEVVGLTSPLNIGLAGVGVHTALRLAQGSSVTMELLGPFDQAAAAAADGGSGSSVTGGGSGGSGSGSGGSGTNKEDEPIAVQCDGEPWTTPAGGSTLTLRSAGRTAVLVPCKEGDRADYVRRVVNGELHGARDEGLIDEGQRSALAQRIAAALDANTAAFGKDGTDSPPDAATWPRGRSFG